MAQISSIYRVGGLYAKKRRTDADKKARKRRKMPYAKFLLTPYWQQVRAAVYERDGHRCRRCGASSGLHVHHKTYAHRGDELRHLGDLVVYCAQCHALEHGGK